MIKEGHSFWEKELYETSYDLIVTGGGLTGQSVALFFKRKNPAARVLVLDRGYFPIGASTRNAGFVCFGTIGEHMADLEIEDEARVKERIKSRYEGLLLLREILGDKYIDYEHSGGWEIFTNEKEFNSAQEQVAHFNEWMNELIGEQEIYEAGSYQGMHAIFNRCEGMLHPGKMIRRLYELNRQAGVEFRWNTPVSNIDPEDGIVYMQDEAEFRAEQVVVATNAFTSKLLPEIKIQPGRGYVFVTKPLNELDWRGTFHFNKGYVYFRNLGDNRMLIGGGRNVASEKEETTEFGINPSVKDYLIRFTNEVIKLHHGWEMEQEWSGIMGFTESKSPVLKKAGERCHVVAGLSGMGVALGMQLGKTAANRL